MTFRVLLIFLLFTVTQQVFAQIGYGRPYYALEKQWEEARKNDKVKTIYSYIFNDSLKANDSADFQYIRHFNKNGQLITQSLLERDTVEGAMKIKGIDSISYTDMGVFKEKRKFLPTNKGGFKLTYRATASINENGQIDTLFIHGKNDVLEAIRVYKYNRSNKIDSTYTFRVKTKKLSTQHTFKYDSKGNLVVRSIKTSSGFSLTLLHYTEDNLLDSYIETYANARETGRTIYTYDTIKRLIRWNYNANSYYYNNLYWSYKGDDRLPYSSYMETPKSKDEKVLKYTYEVYHYEYFE